MKRLIAALVIVLGIGTLCFFSMKNVKKIAQKNLHILNEVIRLQESPDWLYLEKKQDKLEQEFQQDQAVLHLYVGRNKIEELWNTIRESRYFLEIQNKEELFHHYTLMHSLWKNILEEEKISMRAFT